VKRAALTAVLMFVQFGLVTLNFRFIAQAHYVGAVVTDIAIATLGWTLTKRVASADTSSERVGYIVGAALGSPLGIFLTRR
jgi:hypothetical protein